MSVRHAVAAGLIALAGLGVPGTLQAQATPDEITIRAAVLRIDTPAEVLPASRLDLPPADLGLAGGRLATEDNATTGRFLGQRFETREVTAAPEAAAQALAQLLDDGIRFVVTLADAEETGALADQAAGRALVFNARSGAEDLRNGGCRANLLHTAPSDGMRADALAQFLVWKRWDRWLLVAGSHPEDRALAEAYRHAATKFGAKIVSDLTFEDRGGARATDSGHAQVQAQMPVFLQKARDHDVVVTADRSGVFADWLIWNTWAPRPVAGSAGLMPVSWFPGHEGWGATQWQTRFEAEARRPAREEDYQVWLALRSLGEAASRTRSGDFAALSDYIRGPDFQLAGFKGQALSFRDWDGQLRQPILLTSGRVLTSVSPQEGFLHPVSVMDTLGTDRPETGCNLGG
ncbi:ABC transporter substrate-binding protein [Frigidibacter sp. MR17.24]|uniref:ABC transporter substrate-binding protein n=1 Tax=Frigidibacter sp. MR17.24 TaxID=3127345 RepID=UPI003012D7CF